MPSSATRTFTDPEMYFAGIRNLQIDGVITKRGEFRAESTHIDLHRLFMYRSDERLPSDNESSAQWDAGRDRFRDRPWRAVDADQRRRNSGRPNFQNRAGLGMVPSIFGALSMGLRVLEARGSCCREQGDYRARIGAGEFRPQPDASDRCSIAIAEAARSGGPARENRPGHPR